MESPQSGPEFEIVKTTWGAVSIKDKRTGEILHNPVGPWKEAQELYVDQSKLRERLTNPDLLETPLVLFDIGLGAGFNALSAIMLRRSLKQAVRKLKVISFENKLEIFRFAKDNFGAFANDLPGQTPINISEAQNLMTTLLNDERVESESVDWQVRVGDFETLITQETEVPEIVFFDPYSPKVNPEMWGLTCFQNLHRLAMRCAKPSVLMTYSVSTPVRVTLLISGYFVGSGHTSGLKETTFAATSLSEVANPLNGRWLERWTRSQTPLPLGAPELGRDEVEKLLVEHPQFT